MSATCLNWWRETNWYVVHTKANRESFAAGNVAGRGIETFFPRLKQQRIVGGVTRFFIKPLFPGYFFARFCPSLGLDLVRYAHGVLAVVNTGSVPLPLGEPVIAALRAQSESDGCIAVVSPALRPGDWVAIEEGPLQGLMGRIAQEENDERRVTILLETMSHARVSLEKCCLSIAQAA
jgi:transcriptional antiterminator RfaH